jgi:hypothetical protein
LFGLPNAPLPFHVSIINGIVQSRLFLFIVIGVWALYNLKCIVYTLKQLEQSKQNFLHWLNALPAKRVFLCMLFVQVMVYMPVIIYSLAVMFIAFQKHYYLSAIEVLAFNLFALVMSALIYIRAIQKRLTFKILLPLAISFTFKKPLFSIPLLHLLYSRKQMLLITKMFSLLFLYGFINLYVPQYPDIRPVQLCLMLVASSHVAIAYEIRTFEEEYLQFSKILPSLVIVRFGRITGMYACLLIPEIIMLIKGIHSQFTIFDYLQLIVWMIALLCMFHVILYLEDLNMDQMVRIVFGIMAAFFFIILYNPGIFLPISVCCLAFVLFNAYYYVYEKNESKRVS